MSTSSNYIYPHLPPPNMRLLARSESGRCGQNVNSIEGITAPMTQTCRQGEEPGR